MIPTRATFMSSVAVAAIFDNLARWIGACLFTKRLERGHFLWPSMADGRRRRHDQRSPIVLSSVRNRLAHAPGNLASIAGVLDSPIAPEPITINRDVGEPSQ